MWLILPGQLRQILQAVPPAEAARDMTALLLSCISVLAGVVGWLVRERISYLTTQIDRKDKLLDEITPLVREATDMVRQGHADGERRDERMAEMIRAAHDEVKELRMDLAEQGIVPRRRPR